MDNVHPLPVPVAPMLESAIGYDGEARFVGFYWMPAGDEAMVDDGERSHDGNWRAYLAYIRHPRVRLALVDYDVGSSEYPAKHWLVLDRRERRLYALPEAHARHLLRDQHPPRGEPVALSREAWERLTDELNRHMQAIMNDPEHHRLVLEQMAREDTLTRELHQWLDSPN